MLFPKIRTTLFASLFFLGGLMPRAGADASLLFDVGGSSAVFVAPGDSFSFDVFLQADPGDMIVAYDFYLQASGVAGTIGYFTITDRTASTVDFAELNKTDAEVSAPSPGSTLQPWNTESLGAIVSDLDAPVTGSSLYYLATFTFSVSNSATPNPTAFLITSVSTPSGVGIGYWNDSEFAEIPLAEGGSFSVTIVPEPSTYVLLGIGLTAWLWRRRRSA